MNAFPARSVGTYTDAELAALRHRLASRMQGYYIADLPADPEDVELLHAINGEQVDRAEAAGVVVIR